MPADIPLADDPPSSVEVDKIDFIIGNDYFDELFLGDRIQIDAGLYLWSSKFGWILTGRVTPVDSCQGGMSSLCIQQSLASDQVIESTESEDTGHSNTDCLEDFQRVESHGVTGDPSTTGGEGSIQKFNGSVACEEHGEVRWSWKDGLSELLPNHGCTASDGLGHGTRARGCHTIRPRLKPPKRMKPQRPSRKPPKRMKLKISGWINSGGNTLSLAGVSEFAGIEDVTYLSY